MDAQAERSTGAVRAKGAPARTRDRPSPSRTELGAARLPVGAVIVNQVRQSPLPAEALSDAVAGTVDVDALRAGIVAGDLADLPHMSDRLVDEWAAGLAREVVDHADRVTLEQEQRQRLGELGRPVLELPRLSDGIDLAGLRTC